MKTNERKTRQANPETLNAKYDGRIQYWNDNGTTVRGGAKVVAPMQPRTKKSDKHGHCPRCGQIGRLYKFSDGMIDCHRCLSRFASIERARAKTARRARLT